MLGFKTKIMENFVRTLIVVSIDSFSVFKNPAKYIERVQEMFVENENQGSENEYYPKNVDSCDHYVNRFCSEIQLLKFTI